MSANSARILQKAALTFDKTAVLPLVVGKAKQPSVIPQHPRDQPLGSEGSRFAWHIEHLSFQASGPVFHFQLITSPRT
jgi:hypothetical protein